MNVGILTSVHGLRDQWHRKTDKDFGLLCRKKPSAESLSTLKATTTRNGGGPFGRVEVEGYHCKWNPSSSLIRPFIKAAWRWNSRARCVSPVANPAKQGTLSKPAWCKAHTVKCGERLWVQSPRLASISTQFGLREVAPCHSTGGYSPTADLVKQHSDMERTSASQVPPSHSSATAYIGNKWRTDAGVRGFTRPPWTVTQDTLTPSPAWLYRVTASRYARTRPGGGHSVYP